MNESREIKVCLIGDDLSYWEKIENRFETTYPIWTFTFIKIKSEELKNPQHLFLRIHDIAPKILYIDFDKVRDYALSLIKLLFKDNVTKLISTTALHKITDAKRDIELALLAGVRINQIKCDELHDVVYDSISLSDVNMTLKPDYVTAVTEVDAVISQDFRVSYLSENCLHIETNTPFTEGSFLKIEDHFLDKILPNHSFKVSNVRDYDLYYNYRYGMDLDYTFIQRPEGYTDDPNEKEVAEVLSVRDEIEREDSLKKVKKINESMRDWMGDYGKGIDPKKVKLLILDRELRVLRELDKGKMSIPYSLNFQKKLLGNFYQIKRTMPHVIVFSFSSEREFNFGEFRDLCEIIETIDKLENYDPVIAVFGIDSELDEKVRGLSYKKILPSSSDVTLSLVTSLVETSTKKILGKRMIGDEQRVYFSTQTPEAIIKFKRDVKILSMTESILYFSSEEEIPDWTVVHLEAPFDALLTIVPHKDGGPFAREKGVYRSLINGLGEVEKQNVRTFIQGLKKRELS